MSPMVIEEGLEFLFEVGLTIVKAIRGKETAEVALRRVSSIIDGRLKVDADVDAAARGSAR